MMMMRKKKKSKKKLEKRRPNDRVGVDMGLLGYMRERERGDQKVDGIYIYLYVGLLEIEQNHRVERSLRI